MEKETITIDDILGTDKFFHFLPAYEDIENKDNEDCMCLYYDGDLNMGGECQINKLRRRISELEKEAENQKNVENSSDSSSQLLTQREYMQKCHIQALKIRGRVLEKKIVLLERDNADIRRKLQAKDDEIKLLHSDIRNIRLQLQAMKIEKFKTNHAVKIPSVNAALNSSNLQPSMHN